MENYKKKESIEMDQIVKGFEIMPLSWHKRRIPSEIDIKPVNVIVNGFEFKENHSCQLTVELDNKEIVEITGRVNHCCSYNKNCEPIHSRWTIQAANHKGFAVQIKVLFESL
jgi:hypothetical protein